MVSILHSVFCQAAPAPFSFLQGCGSWIEPGLAVVYWFLLTALLSDTVVCQVPADSVPRIGSKILTYLTGLWSPCPYLRNCQQGTHLHLFWLRALPFSCSTPPHPLSYQVSLLFSQAYPVYPGEGKERRVTLGVSKEGWRLGGWRGTSRWNSPHRLQKLWACLAQSGSHWPDVTVESGKCVCYHTEMIMVIYICWIC